MKAIDHCFEKSGLLSFARNFFSRKPEFGNKFKHVLFFRPFRVSSTFCSDYVFQEFCSL